MLTYMYFWEQINISHKKHTVVPIDKWTHFFKCIDINELSENHVKLDLLNDDIRESILIMY